MVTSKTQSRAEPPFLFDALQDWVREVEELGERVLAEKKDALDHGSTWYGFWRWCEDNGHGGRALPLVHSTLAEWLVWAHEALDDQQIEITLRAIRDRHVEAGLRAHIEGLGA